MIIVLFTILLGGVAMVAWALIKQDKEAMTAAVGLLTVALPVSLLVIGLVFGQRGEKRLNKLTQEVLEDFIPEQIRKITCNAHQHALTVSSRAGCRFTYRLETVSKATPLGPNLQFSVELNVRKVNVMFVLPSTVTQHRGNLSELIHYRHVIEGARAEGYTLNEQPANYQGDDGGNALLFFKRLPDDFLLRPVEKLYFSQDLAFFVRAILEAQLATETARLESAP